MLGNFYTRFSLVRDDKFINMSVVFKYFAFQNKKNDLQILNDECMNRILVTDEFQNGI
jgi:hypothetical protein